MKPANKNKFLLIIIIALILSGCFSNCLKENLNDNNIVFFVSPHPDDETLSMGATILYHLAQGDQVHIILLTRGGASSAFERVNELLQRNGMLPLTLEAFMQARVNEFKHAVYTLGVDPEHVHIYDYTDGALKSDDVRQVILEMEKRFNGATHYAFSYHDPHPDHAATGEALLQLYEEQKVTNVGFFVPKYVGLEMGEPIYVPEGYEVFLDAALDAYGIWNPQLGRYAIGHHSIMHAFELAQEAHYDLMHGPGE